ncbi:hypothetical protein [Thermodesulfatator indicus]
MSQDNNRQEDFKHIINKAQQEKKKAFISLAVTIELVYLLERLYKLPHKYGR